jgi:hypothetical protein
MTELHNQFVGRLNHRSHRFAILRQPCELGADRGERADAPQLLGARPAPMPLPMQPLPADRRGSSWVVMGTRSGGC